MKMPSVTHSLQSGIPKDADPFDGPGHADLTAHFDLAVGA